MDDIYWYLYYITLSLYNTYDDAVVHEKYTGPCFNKPVFLDFCINTL